MTQDATPRSGGILVRKPGDVLCFYKLHEDTAKKVERPKQNERGEWLQPFRVEAKERPGIVIFVEPKGDVFLWMASSEGKCKLRMTDGEAINLKRRPQEFRICPQCLVTRKKGQLDPSALSSILDQLTFEGMGGPTKMG